MNKEVMLLATGIGIGALAFTDQGRKLMTAVTNSPLLSGIGGGEESSPNKALEEKPKEKKEEEEKRHEDSEQEMKREE